MAAHKWWTVAYTNELTLLVPGLTWAVFRKKWQQRLCDIARVLALLVTLPRWGAGVEISHAEWVVMGIYTAVLNMAMFLIDLETGPHEFDARAEVFYGLALLSPIRFLLGTPAMFTGVHQSRLRYIAMAANVVTIAYVAGAFIFVNPYVNAWWCYPRPRHPSTFRYGYCPQKTGDYIGNQACIYLNNQTEFSPRCDPDHWMNFEKSTHDLSGLDVHFAGAVLTVSAAVFLVQVPQCVLEMRRFTCSPEKKNF